MRSPFDTILNEAVAAQAKEAAIAQVDVHADVDWKRRAERVVLALAGTGGTFTTDDVWAYIEKPREPRALGAVMRMLAKAKRIQTTGTFKKTAQVLRHHAPIAVWIRGPLWIGY